MTRFKLQATTVSDYTWEVDVESVAEAHDRAWDNLALADMEPDSVEVTRLTIDGVPYNSRGEAEAPDLPYDFGPYGEPEDISQAVRRIRSLTSVLKEPRRQRHIPVEIESYARWLVRRLEL